MFGFISAAGAAATPAVDVFPAEIIQYEPGSYIVVNSDIPDQSWNIEAFGYQFIESFAVTGICTVFDGNDATLDTITTIMADTYSLYTNLVMLPIVENRGGNNPNGVLGITGNPHPFEIIPGYAHYSNDVGNIGGGEGGWQGVLSWSFNIRSYISPT
jgi:hypothetical protein